MGLRKAKEIIKGSFGVDPKNFQFIGPISIQETEDSFIASPENHQHFVSTFQLVSHEGNKDFEIKFGEWNVLQNQIYARLIITLPFYSIIEFKQLLNNFKMEGIEPEKNNSTDKLNQGGITNLQEHKSIKIPMTLMNSTIFFSPTSYVILRASESLIQIYFGRNFGQLTVVKTIDGKTSNVSKPGKYFPYSVTLSMNQIDPLINAIDSNIKNFESKTGLKIDTLDKMNEIIKNKTNLEEEK